MTTPSHRIIHLSETASTNADAMRLALAGEALPLWVSARSQTSGRGRAGRTWLSGEGNLHASLAVQSIMPLAAAGQLSLLAGVALMDAIQGLSPDAKAAGLRLKWPNDILIGTAKVGGILVESAQAPGQPGFLAIVGFGLNVSSCPQVIGRPVTALVDHGFGGSADAVLQRLAGTMERWLEVWQGPEGFAAVREAWLQLSGPIGEAITVHGAAGAVSGTFQGLNSAGALIASIDGRLETVTYGDVMITGPRQTGGSR